MERARPYINTNTFFNTATAIGDAKAWARNLDKKLDTPGGDPFSNSNPNYQIDFYIRTSGLTWGILTSGKLWRLYHRDTSYKLDSFYEVDLEKILISEDTDAFRYFYYFFRSDAFAPGPSNQSFLDDVLSGSIRYTVSVSDDLGDKIYIPIVTPEEQQPIVDLAKRIMAAKVENPLANCSVDEKRIDKRIYDLYRLTKAEVQIVKSSIGQHRRS